MKNKKPLIQIYNQDNKLLGQFDNMQRAMHIFKDLTTNPKYRLFVNGKPLDSGSNWQKGFGVVA